MFGRHYISQVSSVDAQAAFLKETPRSEHFEFLRSAGRLRNTGIPQKISSQARANLENSPEMMATSQRLTDLRLSRQEQSNIYCERELLKKKALQQYQIDWLEEDYWSSITKAQTCDKGSYHLAATVKAWTTLNSSGHSDPNALR